jgi:hypothetical protein
VIVAVPARTAVTLPIASTPTTLASLDVHVMPSPAIAVPLESRGVATSTRSAPSSRVTFGLSRSTRATVGGAGVGASTLMVALPVRPSLVARTIAPPAPIARTTPVCVTVATCSFVELHCTARPDRTEP